MSFLLAKLPPDERDLLDRARAWRCHLHWCDLDVPALAALARAEGSDFATAVLYDRLRRSAEHRAWIDDLEGPDTSLPPAPPGLTVVVAPGAFYKERPRTGADGAVVLEQAARAGIRVARLALDSFGRLEDNARRIVAGLSAIPGEVILVSLSKAAAEVKLALADPALAPGLARVRAWVSLSGLPFGTPLANWLLARRLPSLGALLMVWWHGYSFTTLRRLSWGRGTRLDAPLVVPEGMRVIHVLGFPLARHLSDPLAVRGAARTAAWGPTDGGPFLLGDVTRLQGRIYPVWGCDHYLRPRWDVGRLIRALLRDIVRPDAALVTQEGGA